MSDEERALLERIVTELRDTAYNTTGQFDGAWIGELEEDGHIQIDGFISLLQIIRTVRANVGGRP
jgi:hypothetical protein